MKENDVITDGTAKFIVKKIGGGFEKWFHCSFFWNV